MSWLKWPSLLKSPRYPPSYDLLIINAKRKLFGKVYGTKLTLYLWKRYLEVQLRRWAYGRQSVQCLLITKFLPLNSATTAMLGLSDWLREIRNVTMTLWLNFQLATAKLHVSSPLHPFVSYVSILTYTLPLKKKKWSNCSSFWETRLLAFKPRAQWEDWCHSCD